MKQQNLKVGFLSQWDINDPNAMSGSVHRSMLALKDAGVDIIDLSDIESEMTNAKIVKKIKNIKEYFTKHFPESLKNSYQKKLTQISLTKNRYVTYNDYQKTISRANEISRLAQAKLNQKTLELDVLFGICTSTLFFNLQTELPIIYASDTTANLLNTTYPEYMLRSDGYHQACNEIEKKSLGKSSFFLPAAACAHDSAIEFYELAKEKVHLVEFGAHITPSQALAKKTPPDINNLQLCLVAADPVRKQLDLCISTTEALNNMGWKTVLHYIGPHHDALEKTSVVRWHGRLQLSDSEDRKTHQEIMEASHWMLLPSTAEAFGIAPCEAAHFAVPSIVTDVGGLPTVVQHQHTGVVMPLSANAKDYAEEIISISKDESRYLAMSDAALERAHNTLSWSVWAEKVKSLMYQAVLEKKQVLNKDRNPATSPTPALRSQAL